MLKRMELSDPNSCLNKAAEDEMLFVLLGRDESAVVAVLAWIAHRVASGKNSLRDRKIYDALDWVATVRAKSGR